MHQFHMTKTPLLALPVVCLVLASIYVAGNSTLQSVVIVCCTLIFCFSSTAILSKFPIKDVNLYLFLFGFLVLFVWFFVYGTYSVFNYMFGLMGHFFDFLVTCFSVFMFFCVVSFLRFNFNSKISFIIHGFIFLFFLILFLGHFSFIYSYFRSIFQLGFDYETFIIFYQSSFLVSCFSFIFLILYFLKLKNYFSV